MRITTWLSSALLAASLAACGGKLGKDQCQKLVDHAVDITVKQLGGSADADATKQMKTAFQSQMTDMLDKCQKDGTQSDYDCVMKASTVDQVTKCGD